MFAAIPGFAFYRVLSRLCTARSFALAAIRAFSIAMMMTVAAAMSHAQVLRGVAVDRADQPVAGAIVVLFDSSDAISARALTNDRGEYNLRVPHPGAFRLRVLRIGYLPVVINDFAFTDAAQVITRRLVLDGARVALATVQITGRNACGRQPDGQANFVFAAWDQAMTTVTATQLTTAARGLSATTMQIERALDPTARRVRAQSASVVTNYVTQPWKSVAPALLRDRGYSLADESGATIYNAPGLDALSSPRFLDDHCLRVVKARDSSEIGVAFEPTPARNGRSEIRGTLWMAKESSELRRMDFQYTNVPDLPTVAAPLAGGSMTFTRLRDGSVLISNWEIRMPKLERITGRNATVRVTDVMTMGGNLVTVKRGNDTLFKRSPLNVAGVVTDSSSGRAIERASVTLNGTASQTLTSKDGRFVLNDVLPGEYLLTVRTASLDSVRASSGVSVLVTDGMEELKIRAPNANQLASSVCGSVLTGLDGVGKGAVIGTVRSSSDATPVARVRVQADWTDLVLHRSPAVRVEQTARRIESRTDSTGAFRLCGVPTEKLIVVRAKPDTGRSEVDTTRLMPDQRFVTVALTVNRAQAAAATFAGVVQLESSQQPISDVEITLPQLSLSTRTDANGAFRITDIPPGEHQVIARRIGYGSLDARVTFVANDEEVRKLFMTRISVLDSVNIRAAYADPGMREFEENKRLGLGHFRTREELAKMEAFKMSSVLAQLPAVAISGNGTHAFVVSKRFTFSPADIDICKYPTRFGKNIYVPSRAEVRQGISCNCYAQVYLDNTLMNPGKPTEPFDVNSIEVTQIEAIEWYAGPSETPARYQRLNSACGVYVVHTRRPDL